MTFWSHARAAIQRVFCCGPGANADSSTLEHIYESVDLHQALDTASTLRSVEQSVEEIRQMISLIAGVPDSIRRLEMNLHPLLLYRPEDGEYMVMNPISRPVAATGPAAPPPSPEARSVEDGYVAWLQERVDYGEPW